MRKIIIDTDPGQDDAVAILLALASRELEVLGITAVAGNVPLPLTEVNVRKTCELAGRTDIGVYAGADRPLERALVTAEHVHGKTGIDGPDLPEPTMPLRTQHGVDFLIEQVMDHAPGTITLCALGPLTNLATAIRREPEFAPRVAEIVLMGGGYFEGGNITPAAEFNIYVDPEAAATVCAAGIDLTIIPLDCTHKALTTRARVEAFRAIGTPVGDAVADLIGFFERFDEAKYGTDGAPLHDPCVIAQLLQPDLFTGRTVNVEIETGSELTRGATVVDWWRVTDRPANATVLGDVDAEGYFKLLTERIARL